MFMNLPPCIPNMGSMMYTSLSFKTAGMLVLLCALVLRSEELSYVQRANSWKSSNALEGLSVWDFTDRRNGDSGKRNCGRAWIGTYYTLLRSFSQMSNWSWSRSFVLHHTFVLVLSTDTVPLPLSPVQNSVFMECQGDHDITPPFSYLFTWGQSTGDWECEVEETVGLGGLGGVSETVRRRHIIPGWMNARTYLLPQLWAHHRI